MRETVAAALPAIDRPVDVTLVSKVDAQDTVIHGGGALSGCTAGFTVRVGAYVRGISTAAHCGNSQYYEGRRLNLVQEHLGYWGDVQWHISPDSESVSDYFYYDWGLLRAVNAVGNLVTNQAVCRFGRTTGTKCSTVYTAANYCVGSVCNLALAKNRQGNPGDSGGPWYYGNTAYGIHKGYVYAGLAYRDMFSQVRYLPNAIGVNVIS